MACIELKYHSKIFQIFSLTVSTTRTERFTITQPIRITEASGNHAAVIDLSEVPTSDIPKRLELLSGRSFELVRIRPTRKELAAYKNHETDAPLRSGVTHSPLPRFSQRASNEGSLRVRIYHALD